MIRIAIITGIGLVAPMHAFADISGDADAGADLFRQCAICHQVGPDAANGVGPALEDIVGAVAGKVEGFRYSRGMEAAVADGLIWTPEALDAFLEKPRNVVARTSMSFAGVRDPAKRADLIAYLGSLSSTETTDATESYSAPVEVLSMEGDIAYGEYLASECTSCHQASGDNDGIPGIVGWPTDAFVTAMYSYKDAHRENQVMQMIAGRLGGEEIAALAAYFEKLGD